MLRLILLLFFLIASVWLGIQLSTHSGYVLLIYQPWIVQIPVWFALLITILFLIIFYCLITGIDHLQFMWLKLKYWLRFRKEKKALNKTQQAVSAYIEGQFSKAEHLFLISKTQNDEYLSYMGSALAAEAQHAYDRADTYLQKASQVAPQAELSITIIKVNMLLRMGKTEEASEILNRLYKKYPKHPAVLKALEKIYLRTSNWAELLILLPELRKTKVLTNVEAEKFEKNIYCEIWREKEFKNVDEVYQFWNDLPRQIRKNPDVIYAYIKQLLRFPGTAIAAEELIRKTVNAQWQDELVVLYGNLPANNINQQLATAGEWVKKYGAKPELFLILGKLCVRAQLWGKAKDYFEKCLHPGPNAEASFEYGKLLEHLNKPEEAMVQYRLALAQVK